MNLFFQLKAQALQRKHLQGESGVKASVQRGWLPQLLPGWLLGWGLGTELPSWNRAWCFQVCLWTSGRGPVLRAAWLKKGLSDRAFGVAAWVYRVYVCRGGDRLLFCV